jgi:hypothetical protein
MIATGPVKAGDGTGISTQLSQIPGPAPGGAPRKVFCPF